MDLFDATKTYERIKEEIKKELSQLPSLTLASLVVGKDYSSSVYLSSQKKLADELGVKYFLVELEQTASQQEIVKKIEELNQEEGVTAIVANKPFPKGIEEEDVFGAIDIKKDIEGMNPYNLGKLFTGKNCFISPTVLSILEFLKMSKAKLYGKEIVIVGFSTLIGKPLSILLGREFATVTITHIGTFEAGKLPFHVSNADIVISAAGVPELIKGSWLKQGVIIIDVGVASKQGKLVGDVEFEAAKEKASFITPVKGGVGKLTSIFLFKNLIQAAKLQG